MGDKTWTTDQQPILSTEIDYALPAVTVKLVTVTV